jgi:hypothetical protein
MENRHACSSLLSLIDHKILAESEVVGVLKAAATSFENVATGAASLIGEYYGF